MKEPLLEPILRYFRINRVLPEIKNIPECKLLDIGCGWNARFLKDVEEIIACGVGIDFKAPNIISKYNKIKTISANLEKKLPFENESFDAVSMLAVLEHLEHPKEVIHETYRILRPGGKIIITVPSIWSKPVLEFLSFKIGIVNREEILDHKMYYEIKGLTQLLSGAGFVSIRHQYFQLRMNNFCTAIKK